jgi:hypothetical protein
MKRNQSKRFVSLDDAAKYANELRKELHGEFARAA